MGVDRTRLPEVGADPVFRFPEIVRHRFANGLDVRTIEHRTVPVVTMVVQIEGGSGADPAGREGLAAITADMVDEGTGSLSAIDVSDGLIADLGHICERSGVGAVLDWETLPARPIVRAYAQSDRGARSLLSGGDDYELCFTAPPAKRSRVARAAARARVPVTLVGRIARRPRGRPAVTLLDSVGKPLTIRVQGHDHFR